MNAQALLTQFKTGHSKPKKQAKDFPPEAFEYGDIDPAAIARIQAEADKKLDKQDWTVIEQIVDDGSK